MSQPYPPNQDQQQGQQRNYQPYGQHHPESRGRR
jgi:hypothetical protein